MVPHAEALHVVGTVTRSVFQVSSPLQKCRIHKSFSWLNALLRGNCLGSPSESLLFGQKRFPLDATGTLHFQRSIRCQERPLRSIHHCAQPIGGPHLLEVSMFTESVTERNGKAKKVRKKIADERISVVVGDSGEWREWKDPVYADLWQVLQLFERLQWTSPEKTRSSQHPSCNRISDEGRDPHPHS